VEDLSRILKAVDRFRTMINLAKNRKALSIADDDRRPKLLEDVQNYEDQLTPISEVERRFIASLTRNCELILPEVARSTSKGFFERTHDGFSGAKCPIEHKAELAIDVNDGDTSQKSETKSRFYYLFTDAVHFTDIRSIEYNRQLEVISSPKIYRTEVTGPLNIQFRDRSFLRIDGVFDVTGKDKERTTSIRYKYIFYDPQNKPIGRHTLIADGYGQGRVRDEPEKWSMSRAFAGRVLTEPPF